MVQQLKTLSELRHYVNAAKMQTARIAFVPTMGSLHAGHLALVTEAQRQKRRVIASIFVNPKQFGPNEDFVSYPRDLEGDLNKLKSAGVDAVYLPSVEDMYPTGFATLVQVSGFNNILEGEHRPGHMDGVATVVTKLLLQVQPDVVFMGEKDFQQLQLVKRLVADLSIPTGVVGVSIVRENSGLAKSSRNAYLNAAEREIAPSLYKTIIEVANNVMAGGDIAQAVQEGKDALLAAGFSKVDYIAVCDPQTLELADRLGDKPLRVLAAAHLGKTRLIDNVTV